MPRPNTWTASFPARLETATESTGGGSGRGSDGGATGGGCSNPATDGVYVYVWEASSKRLHKVRGTMLWFVLFVFFGGGSFGRECGGVFVLCFARYRVRGRRMSRCVVEPPCDVARGIGHENTAGCLSRKLERCPWTHARGRRLPHTTAARGDDLFECLFVLGATRRGRVSVLVAVMSVFFFAGQGNTLANKELASRDTTAGCHRALTALHETSPGRSFVGALFLACSQVGTGFHGTLPGNVYCFRPHILDDIRAFKGMEPAPQDEPTEDVLNTSTASEVRRRRRFKIKAHGDLFLFFVFFGRR